MINPPLYDIQIKVIRKLHMGAALYAASMLQLLCMLQQ